MKIFSETGTKAAGRLLPYDAFRPFSELGGFSPRAEYREGVIKAAEDTLGMEYPQPTAAVYMMFKRNGNRSVYEGLAAKRRTMVFTLALAEYLERKGRFTDKLIDGVWLLLEETTWVIPAHNKSRPGTVCSLTYSFGEEVDYIDLFSAETGALLAWVYYLDRDILDRETIIISSRILYELERRITRPFMKYDDMWWMGFGSRGVNNWNPWIISNILTVYALCMSDAGEREAAVDRAMVMLDVFAGGYKPDGGCDEGPSYWSAAGASYFDCLELLYDMSGGKIDVFGVPLVRKMGEYICDMHIAGDYYVNFADCAPRLVPSYAMIARFGERTGSEKLKNFGESMRTGVADVFTPTYVRFYRKLKDMCGALSSSAALVPPAKTWLDGICVMSVREGDLYLAMKGGHNGESHNHNDVGNFVAYVDGEPLFCDAGVAKYTAKTFGSERYTLWTMQSQYHNLPTINGVMQSPGGNYRADGVEYDPETGGLALGLVKTYKPEAKLRKFVRHGGITDGRIVVTDDIELDGAGEIVFNLLTPERPDISVPGTLRFAGASVGYDGRLSAEVEEIPLDDSKLKGDWRADVMYRVRLSVSGVTGGAFSLAISK